MEVTNLNAGVSIKKLYADLDNDTVKKIEEYAKDGFTAEEIQKLKDDGVDTTLITKNGTTTDTEEIKAPKEATDNDVASKVKELKAKYSAKKGGGDPYKMSNPQLKAFKQAMDDGLIGSLAQSGFSKTQIIKIINEVFPSIGIKGNGDNYSCPKGHDKEAKALYDQFISELSVETDGINQEILAQRALIQNICKQIQSNNNKINVLEMQIMSLQDEIEETINKAIEESEEIVENQKEDAKDVVSRCLSAYVSADGEMTYEEFQRNVASGLDDVAGTANSKLSSVVTNMLNAERKMATLDGYLGQMSDLLKSNKDLQGQLTEAQNALDELNQKKADMVANGCPDKCCKRCDPIGFTEGKVHFDFFVDKDGNSDISNEKEFLGAENGFAEVKALDTDGDGIVTKEELEKGNVKVVQTNSDGSQEIKNIADIFGEGDSINLNSYQAQHSEMSNGNALVGTFNVTKDGQELNGYQTLDTLDWLDDNFNFTDADESVGRFSTNFDKSIEGVEAMTDETKYNEFTQKTAELRDKMDQVYTRLGFDAQEIKNGISAAAKKEAKKEAERVEETFTKEEEGDAKIDNPAKDEVVVEELEGEIDEKAEEEEIKKDEK